MAKKRGLESDELTVLRLIRAHGSMGFAVYSTEQKVVRFLVKRGYVTVQTTGHIERAFTTHEGNIVLADKGPFIVEAEVAFSFAQRVEQRVRVYTDPYYSRPLGWGVAFPHVWQTAIRYAYKASECQNPPVANAGLWEPMFRWACTAIEEFCSGDHAKAESALDMIDCWGKQAAARVQEERARYAAEVAARKN